MDKFETYRTVGGTCCKQIIFSVNKENILTSCKFVHGCSGNQQAITRLCVGQNIDFVIDRLKGIPCRGNTSCPDQLSRALTEFKQKQDQPKK